MRSWGPREIFAFLCPHTHTLYTVVSFHYCILYIEHFSLPLQIMMCIIKGQVACPAQGTYVRTLSQQRLRYLQKEHKIITTAGQS